MSLRVHITHVFVLCVLFALTVLPWTVFSNEGESETPSPEAAASEASPVVLSPSAKNTHPYTTETIPGGSSVVGDFVVGPGKIDVTLKPGESTVIEMTVTNRTGEKRIFNLTTEDMTGSDDPSIPVVLLGSDRGPYSLRDYIHIPEYHFELDHNERARIPVTINIPADAEPGGLYGSVLVDTVAIEAESGTTGNASPQSAIVARIGTLFFVTIPGVVEKEGALKTFGTVPPRTFYQSGPISFGVLFGNTGSIHLAPYGEVRVTNMLGEEVGSVDLEPWFIFPHATRLREITWDREFLFGRYTATISLNRSYDDIIDTKSFSFWVLPWKVLLLGFIGVFVTVFLIRTFFRTFEFSLRKK